MARMLRGSWGDPCKATKSLRRLAAALSERSKLQVDAVSARFAAPWPEPALQVKCKVYSGTMWNVTLERERERETEREREERKWEVRNQLVDWGILSRCVCCVSKRV